MNLIGGGGMVEMHNIYPDIILSMYILIIIELRNFYIIYYICSLNKN